MSYDFSHIEEYLEGRLSTEDKEAFEASLSVDKSLQEEVNLYKEMHQFVQKETDIDASVKNLSEVHNEFTQGSSPDKIHSNWTKFFILLTILLFTSLIFYFSTKDKEPEKPEIIYAALFDPQPISLASRGAEDNLAIIEIAQFYNHKKYKEAITNIQKLDVSIDDLPRLQYINGVSQLAENSLEDSRSILTALKNDYSIYTDDANWYIGLSYLKEENSRAAVEYFKMLPSSYLNNKDGSGLVNELIRSLD